MRIRALRVIWQLYADPAAMRALIRKVGSLMRGGGVPALRRAVAAKLAHPTLAVGQPMGAAATEPWSAAYTQPASTRRFDRATVSIIILTKGRADLVMTCLGAVAATLTPTTPVSITIVNNGAALPVLTTTCKI